VARPRLAEPEEIQSDWVIVKDANRPAAEQSRVKVSGEAFIYAVDQALVTPREFTGPRVPAKHDQTVVQIHRWMETVKTEDGSEFPVGDWLVSERLLVNRGEYLVKWEQTDVPVWLQLDQKFGLKSSRKDKMAVLWNMDAGEGNLLVLDVQGGSINHRKVIDPKPITMTISDKAPTELILMKPDGKLLVRSSSRDAVDRERIERHRKWEQSINDLLRQ
jgi:hypothetical protein